MNNVTRTPISSGKQADAAERQLLLDAVTALRFIHDFYSLDTDTWIKKYSATDGTVKAMRSLTGKVLADASQLGFKGDSRAAMNMVRTLRRIEGAA